MVGPYPGCQAQSFYRAWREAGARHVLRGKERTACLSRAVPGGRVSLPERRSRELCSFFPLFSDQPSFISESPGGLWDSETQGAITYSPPCSFQSLCQPLESLILSEECPFYPLSASSGQWCAILSCIHKIVSSLPPTLPFFFLSVSPALLLRALRLCAFNLTVSSCGGWGGKRPLHRWHTGLLSIHTPKLFSALSLPADPFPKPM